MTTLSHLELVSCRVDGSSSSQSANLLNAPSQSVSTTNEEQTSAPVQFLRFLDNLLLVFVIALRRSVLLRLVTKVCRCHLHLSRRRRLAQSEICVIQHLDCQIYTFGAEI